MGIFYDVDTGIMTRSMIFIFLFLSISFHFLISFMILVAKTYQSIRREGASNGYTGVPLLNIVYRNFEQVTTFFSFLFFYFFFTFCLYCFLSPPFSPFPPPPASSFLGALHAGLRMPNRENHSISYHSPFHSPFDMSIPDK
ncbi:hypothetical protein HOY80DRAFT_19466 [Tuber brumale]|nr:hypothetical protein HOY80DRAFT_19466 [Tuber brumale]